MEKTEIKKALYKQNPKATRISITEDVHYYACVLDNDYKVEFFVHRSDMGENEFETELPAKLLIRWLIPNV